MVEPPKVLNFVESLFLFYTFIIHQISYCTHISCENYMNFSEVRNPLKLKGLAPSEKMVPDPHFNEITRWQSL
jgi:hypothetical protein